MNGVPDEVLAAMFAFCLAGCYAAWRVTKRTKTKLSAVIGVIWISVFVFYSIRKHYQYGFESNESLKLMPETSTSSAPVPPEMVRVRYHPPPPTCPDYFRWIHEDLRPWRNIGITEETIEKGKKSAYFRLVVLNGTAYLEIYKESVQTRDKFTIWGILQLLQKYPGRIPDLDLMFFCHDIPQVKVLDHVRRDFSHSSSSASWSPPPIFSYCSDEDSLDIVFPDWSFWGWAEVNIKPWEMQLKDMAEEKKKRKWVDREPYAYWKGNKEVCPLRGNLMKCNLAADGSADWNARLFHQNWYLENENGFLHSNLKEQCNYRYKIYVDGYAWSVSKKYILACDSPVLMVDSKYHDFFSRGLMPLQHYYPINVDFMCDSINSTVTFGKSHPQEVREVGREGSAFIEENLKMDRVYDYMFHLLNEYSKLMRFKPKPPENAVKISPESMAEKEQGLVKEYMMDSRVTSDRSSSSYQCTLPPPFTPGELKSLLRRKNVLAKHGYFLNDGN